MLCKILIPIVLAWQISGALASEGARDPYFGMTRHQFESCIRYGRAVVDSKAATNKKKGQQVYDAARIEFNRYCDPKKQLSYGISHLVKKIGPGGIPVKPEDWAALGQQGSGSNH